MTKKQMLAHVLRNFVGVASEDEARQRGIEVHLFQCNCRYVHCLGWQVELIPTDMSEADRQELIINREILSGNRRPNRTNSN